MTTYTVTESSHHPVVDVALNKPNHLLSLGKVSLDLGERLFPTEAKSVPGFNKAELALSSATLAYKIMAFAQGLFSQSKENDQSLGDRFIDMVSFDEFVGHVSNGSEALEHFCGHAKINAVRILPFATAVASAATLYIAGKRLVELTYYHEKTDNRMLKIAHYASAVALGVLGLLSVAYDIASLPLAVLILTTIYAVTGIWNYVSSKSEPLFPYPALPPTSGLTTV